MVRPRGRTCKARFNSQNEQGRYIRLSKSDYVNCKLSRILATTRKRSHTVPAVIMIMMHVRSLPRHPDTCVAGPDRLNFGFFGPFRSRVFRKCWLCRAGTGCAEGVFYILQMDYHIYDIQMSNVLASSQI